MRRVYVKVRLRSKVSWLLFSKELSLIDIRAKEMYPYLLTYIVSYNGEQIEVIVGTYECDTRLGIVESDIFRHCNYSDVNVANKELLKFLGINSKRVKL